MNFTIHEFVKKYASLLPNEFVTRQTLVLGRSWEFWKQYSNSLLLLKAVAVCLNQYASMSTAMEYMGNDSHDLTHDLEFETLQVSAVENYTELFAAVNTTPLEDKAMILSSQGWQDLSE